MLKPCLKCDDLPLCERCSAKHQGSHNGIEPVIKDQRYDPEGELIVSDATVHRLWTAALVLAFSTAVLTLTLTGEMIWAHTTLAQVQKEISDIRTNQIAHELSDDRLIKNLTDDLTKEQQRH